MVPQYAERIWGKRCLHVGNDSLTSEYGGSAQFWDDTSPDTILFDTIWISSATYNASSSHASTVSAYNTSAAASICFASAVRPRSWQRNGNGLRGRLGHGYEVQSKNGAIRRSIPILAIKGLIPLSSILIVDT